jgi:hypothetical protein
MSTRRAKRPGTIEAPRGTIKTVRDKVTVDILIKNKPQRKIMYITSYETESSVTIYIGSSNIYCIDCQLLNNPTIGVYDTGILTKARWDIECSINDPFEKGVDSIIIIKLLLTYIKDKYPSVTQLLFTDMSTKECDNGSSVNLAAMKVFTDGKTWYESHFDVSIDESNKILYDNMLSYGEKKKSEMSYDEFIGYTYPGINKLKISDDDLIHAYNTSNTWQEFFLYIRNTIGISNFCIWLSVNNWFDRFVFAVLKFNTMSLQFIFNPKKYDIEYTIIRNGGGKHVTLKKKRA